MPRRSCGDQKEVPKIQSIAAPLLHMVVGVLWLGHEWLPQVLAHLSSLMSCTINSELDRNISSAKVPVNASKLIGRSFILQQDNDPKHPAEATPEFLSVETWNIPEWLSQSPDLNPAEHDFYMLKKKLKGTSPRNKQELKVAERHQRRYSASGDVIRLQAVIVCKRYATRC